LVRRGPRSDSHFPEDFGISKNYSVMAFYRRRLPHFHQSGQPILLTLRLQDSLPHHRTFPAAALNSGQAFAFMDRLPDEARVGSLYLRQPLIADMIVKRSDTTPTSSGTIFRTCLRRSCSITFICGHSPCGGASDDQIVKGITAKRANTMLALTGRSFWQDESYDHLVRHEREFGKIRNYIEENPVRAGLVTQANEYR
jgi:putative transposase